MRQLTLDIPGEGGICDFFAPSFPVHSAHPNTAALENYLQLVDCKFESNDIEISRI